MNEKNFKYILFDGDVTLIDFKRSYNEALRYAIAAIPYTKRRLLGIFVKIFRSVIFKVNDFGILSANESKLNFSLSIISLIYLNFDIKKFVSINYEIEGATKLLKDLKQEGYVIVLVSNNSQNEKFANDSEIEKQYIYIPSLKFKATKPLLNKLFLEENDVNPEECLFVGDSYRDDILYAKRCGIKSVLIKEKSNSFLKFIFKPDYYVKNLMELRKLLIAKK